MVCRGSVRGLFKSNFQVTMISSPRVCAHPAYRFGTSAATGRSCEKSTKTRRSQQMGKTLSFPTVLETVFTWSRREELLVEPHLVPAGYGDRHRLNTVVAQFKKSRHLARHNVAAAARVRKTATGTMDELPCMKSLYKLRYLYHARHSNKQRPAISNQQTTPASLVYRYVQFHASRVLCLRHLQDGIERRK